MKWFIHPEIGRTESYMVASESAFASGIPFPSFYIIDLGWRLRHAAISNGNWHDSCTRQEWKCCFRLFAGSVILNRYFFAVSKIKAARLENWFSWAPKNQQNMARRLLSRIYQSPILWMQEKRTDHFSWLNSRLIESFPNHFETRKKKSTKIRFKEKHRNFAIKIPHQLRRFIEFLFLYLSSHKESCRDCLIIDKLLRLWLDKMKSNFHSSSNWKKKENVCGNRYNDRHHINIDLCRSPSRGAFGF